MHTEATGADAAAATDLDHARALPARYYVGDEVLAMEQRAVFARSWQPLAHQDQLAEPGDHVVGEIAGVPVILVRGRDGVLRAFPNVCRHRAGPLALCNGKGAHSLQCKYHGWTYTLDGQLRSAPEMKDVPDFDVGAIHLPPLRVHEWQGLVFVALGNDVPDFDEVYGGIAEHIAPIDLSAMRYLRSVNYDVDCNWKVYVDNYLEGYHLQARIVADQDFSDEVQNEDIAICEAVQKGLGSGFYAPGRLCPRRESGVWHFQNLLRAAYAGPAGEHA